MIHLILDSTVYRSDITRKSAAFQTLSIFLKKTHITLHLPYIVEKEFTSYLIEEFKVHNNKILKELKIIKKIMSLDSDIQIEILNVQSANEKIQENFRLWVKENNIKTYPLNVKDASKVFESYFNGSKPFKKVKNRDDIPDAFLFENVKDIKHTQNDVHFVSNDTFLFEAVNDLAIITHKTLNDFISSGYCKNFRDKIMEEKLIQYIQVNQAEIISLLKNRIVNSLVYKEIYSEKIPDDNNVASIMSVSPPSEINFDFDDYNYYSDGIFVMSCNFDTVVNAVFYIYKPDYYAMDETFDVTDHNEHYFETEQEFNINVSAKIRFEFELSTDHNDHKSIQDLNKCDIDSIDKIEVQ